MTQCLCIHQPVYLRSLPHKCDSLSKSSVDKALDVWDMITFKARNKTEWRLLVSELDQFLLPVHMCFLLCGRFWAFCYSATCALYQTVCASIHKPVFCPIIWFANYSNRVSLMQLCTSRYAFDGNTFGTEGWEWSLGLAKLPSIETKNFL